MRARVKEDVGGRVGKVLLPGVERGTGGMAERSKE